MANPATLIDGEPSLSLPADDRGLAYGDGIFRTILMRDGEPVAWADHMQRLANDCRRLRLIWPAAEDLRVDSRKLFPENRDGVLKIIVTRGSGGRGYAPVADGHRRIVSAHALPEQAKRGAALKLERSPVVLAEQPRLAGVKHLNRLEQVLARAECEERGAADTFMCDGAGRIISTTMRNLLFVDARERWLTPALSRAGVCGATRQRLLRELKTRGIDVAETDIPGDVLNTMRGAIACNSVGGVVPIVSMDEIELPASDKMAAYCCKLLAHNGASSAEANQ